MFENLIPFLQIGFACFLLAKACAAFEQPAGFLGRNMPAGIKGATVNAVGSSMPEMMSAFVLLFWYNDPAAFAIALGITAGSGVYNTAVIPPLAILFAKKDGEPVRKIELNPRNLARDVFWVVLSDVVLIGLIFYGYISFVWAIVLNLIYIGYAIHLYKDSVFMAENEVEPYEEESLPNHNDVLGNLVECNFHMLIFSGKQLTTGIAVCLLIIATVIITLGSHVLVEGVIGASNVLGIPDFISGLVLGAAASSLPDTILSIQDAKKGNYEDAVANPLASNTFDTSISLGFPLVLWLLWTGNEGIAIVGENMEALRISVVAMSASVGLTLLYKHKSVGRGTAWFILAMYLVWISWIGFTYV